MASCRQGATDDKHVEHHKFWAFYRSPGHSIQHLVSDVGHNKEVIEKWPANEMEVKINLTGKISLLPY